MQVISESRVPLKMWTDGVQVEDSARKQLLNVASLPFVGPHVAVMPDVHWGMGATVGSVIPTEGAIIPAAVGVDIGCGMMAVKLNLRADQLPDNLAAIRSAIEKAVPHGRTNDGKTGDRGAWGDARSLPIDLVIGLHEIVAMAPKLEKPAQRAQHHIGTLGTGNHFIEICLDENDDVWVMLHSGSRGIGNAIGTYFINLAREEMKRWFVNIPDRDLGYLPEGSQHFNNYIKAVHWAQEFAMENRSRMMFATLKAMNTELGRLGRLPGWSEVKMEAVNCHHNYVNKERHYGRDVWLTRKGAVSAKKGELGIIPGSMGAKSFIVCGKGHLPAFCSCSHGAGRSMSRTEAKKRFTVEDHIKATEGVECRKDADVIDETPQAYKDIDAVMAAQSDLVDVVHTLKQVMCVKG